MVARNLLRRKTRALLTLTGVSIGIAAIIALGAIAQGMEARYASLSRGADLVITQKNSLDISVSIVEEEVGEKLAAMEEGAEVAGIVLNLVPVSDVRYFPLLGYTPGSFPLHNFPMIRGEQPGASGELALGILASRHLRKSVGDSVEVYGRPFHIVGIYDTGNPQEDGAGVVTLEDAQALAKQPGKVAAFLVKLQNIEEVEAVRQKIESQFPQVSVSLAKDFSREQTEVEIFRSLGWAVSFLALLVGGVGVANTLAMSVAERKREIGILRAIGWRKGRILRMILTESLLLCLAGGLLGMLLGIGVVISLNTWQGAGALLQATLSPHLFVQAGVVAVFLGIGGGLLPAYHATRVMPVEALRHEGGSSGGSNYVLPGGMVVRNILRRRGRSLLTIVGISIAIAVVIATVGFADGFVQQFTSVMSRGGIDLVVRQADISDLSYSAIDEQVGKDLAALPQVEQVSGGIMWATRTEESPLFILFGYDPAEYAIKQFQVVEGRIPEEGKEIMLGRGAASGLKKKVGDEVKMQEAAYHVVGIFESEVVWENSAGVLPLREAQLLWGKPGRVMFYTIKLGRPEQAGGVELQIQRDFPQISVSRSAEFAAKLPDMHTTRLIATIISLLVIVVGGIGVMNTMVMSVFERKREIGVLRAVGWRKRKVIGLVLQEAALLSLIAGVAGIFLGLGLSGGIGLMPVAADILQPSFGLFSFARGLGIAIVLGVLGGLYPAWQAARMSPVEALRYE